MCILTIKAASITQTEKSEFIKFYRNAVKLDKEFPNNPEVKAIFVDLDGDGKDEALASSRGSSYEDGRDWAIFVRTAETWKPVQGFDNEAKIIRPGSGVFARSGEIFRVIKNDGTLDFLILSENFDNRAPDGLGTLRKSRFFVDKDGVLRQESVENLERYIAYLGVNKSGLIGKLEALKVESFQD